jgi:hypothetical protein
MRQETPEKPQGEIGTLQHVLKPHLFDNKIYIFIVEKGVQYMGLVPLDDPTFCSRLFRFLELQIGRSIKEVADLDMAYILWKPPRSGVERATIGR